MSIVNNLDVFEKHKDIQKKIGDIDRMVEELEFRKEPNSLYWASIGSRDIQNVIGYDLALRVGPSIITILQSEKVKLIAEQESLSLKVSE